MQFSFDATNIDTTDDRSFEPIPQGKYTAMIVESSVKPTKSGTGQYIELVCQVLDGAHTNRKIWWRLNIVNANPKAEEIGRRELAVLMVNLDLGPNLQDTQELHGKPFVMGLKIRQQDGYEPTNDVSFTTAMQVGQAAPAMGMAQQTAAQPAPQAQQTAPPWV